MLVPGEGHFKPRGPGADLVGRWMLRPNQADRCNGTSETLEALATWVGHRLGATALKPRLDEIYDGRYRRQAI